MLGGEFEAGLAHFADRLSSRVPVASSHNCAEISPATAPGRSKAATSGSEAANGVSEIAFADLVKSFRRSEAASEDSEVAFGNSEAAFEDSEPPFGSSETSLGGQGFRPDISATPKEGASAPEVSRPQPEPVISLARQKFLVPDRTGLVPLDRYAKLTLPGGGSAVVGYTEASRGCKHRCRHCPVVPVYNGVFRIIPPEIVIDDIRQQVHSGARHITFGDPDFFNGPRHALAIVRALHKEFPHVTYDATIKVEHLLARQADLPVLRDTGCLFVTTAVESLDDAVLARLEKGHTRADFLEVVRLFDDSGLSLHPTFIPFTPWTTLDTYADLLDTLASLDLTANVAPVQLAIRLLVPAGSRLLELEELRHVLAPFDPESLVYPWRHNDPRVDRLQREIEQIVKASQSQGRARAETFAQIERAARAAALGTGRDAMPSRPQDRPRISRAAIPYLTEPWYC
ncbi:MAG: radical SAM protein [Acidobacteriota bacterium]|nr:radical SAM protein [Acidobacteriota bacterium]